MKSQLFRPEVLEERRSKALGDVAIVSPPSFGRLTILFVAIAGMLCMFLFFGSYARKETVSGYLVPDRGLIRLYAPYRGRIVERKAAQGDVVDVDDVLLVLNADRSSAEDRDVDASVAAELERQRADLLRRIANEKVRGESEKAALGRQALSIGEEIEQVQRQLELERQRTEEFGKESLVEERRQRYNKIYDRLGRETFIKWFHEYPEKYSKENLLRLRKK